MLSSSTFARLGDGGRGLNPEKHRYVYGFRVTQEPEPGQVVDYG